jgi:hypothetical protein
MPRLRSVNPPPRCPMCGYELAGAGGPCCPECAWAIEPAETRRGRLAAVFYRLQHPAEDSFVRRMMACIAVALVVVCTGGVAVVLALAWAGAIPE